MESLFQDNGKNAETWPVKVQFGSKVYDGKVFYRPPTKARSSTQHKILIKEENKTDNIQVVNKGDIDPTETNEWLECLLGLTMAYFLLSKYYLQIILKMHRIFLLILHHL